MRKVGPASQSHTIVLLEKWTPLHYPAQAVFSQQDHTGCLVVWRACNLLCLVIETVWCDVGGPVVDGDGNTVWLFWAGGVWLFDQTVEVKLQLSGYVMAISCRSRISGVMPCPPLGTPSDQQCGPVNDLIQSHGFGALSLQDWHLKIKDWISDGSHPPIHDNFRAWLKLWCPSDQWSGSTDSVPVQLCIWCAWMRTCGARKIRKIAPIDIQMHSSKEHLWVIIVIQ